MKTFFCFVWASLSKMRIKLNCAPKYFFAPPHLTTLAPNLAKTFVLPKIITGMQAYLKKKSVNFSTELLQVKKKKR